MRRSPTNSWPRPPTISGLSLTRPELGSCLTDAATAPDVYRMLGSAAELAYALPQALTQMSEALRRSLTVFDIYDRDRQPADSIALATRSMMAAADAFAVAAQSLSEAQAAIAHQGVNEDSTGNLRRRPTLRLAPE
jgi:hypothetical protein